LSEVGPIAGLRGQATLSGHARNLKAKASVAPDDVFIFTHENDYSDWSVGGGKFAMALVQQPRPA